MIVLGIFLLVMLPYFEKPRSFFKSGFDTAIYSLGRAYHDTVTLYFRSQNSDDIEILRHERNSLAGSEGEKIILKEENTSLKRMLQFRERSGYELFGVHIIARSTDLGRSMLVIDRGARDGIKKDFPVIAQDGVLIGKVAAVRYETSFIRLLQDPKSKVIAAYKANSKIVQGLVTGKFHTGIELALIPITEPLEKGALLTTTGTEEFVPAGLLIGFISDFNSMPTDLFYTIQIKPALPISDLSLLSVIMPSKSNGN